MAEAYTKTIEFKAKDAQIRKAVKDLGKSLEGIDKSLDKINEAFNKSIRVAIKETAKEVGNISKAVKDLTKVAKGLEIVPRQKITASIQGVKRIESVLKRLRNVASPFGSNKRLSDEYNEASKELENYISSVAKGNQAIAANEAGLRRQAAAFNLVASNARITSQQFADGVTAQLKAEEKLRTAQLERIRIQERLYTTDFTQGGTKIDATGFKGVEGILGAEDQISNTKASLSAYKAELENINRFLTIGGDQYNRVEQAITRINGKLGLNLKTQKDTTTEVSRQATLLELTGQKLRQFSNFSGKGMLGLLTGKIGGRPGQAAGVWGMSAGIEGLTKILSGLNIGFIDNTRAISHWVRKATEGVAAVSLAYTGLSTVLGAASWTIGAIAGFKRWESEAAQAIWRTNRQVKNLVDNLGAMFWMMQGKGGTAGGVGSLLKDMTLGGLERQENKQGPTHLQNLQRDLDLQVTKLRQRNTTEADYIQILQSKMQLEREIRRETRKQKVMEVKAGKPFEEVFADEIAAADNRKMERLREYNKERETSIKKGDKLIKDANTRIAKAGQDRLKEVQSRWRIEATNHGKEVKRIRERQQLEKRRTADRRAAMSRFGENVMLGAGFPMLFGGGPGAVAGGLTGAIGQSALGSKGFGMQIFFSAIGQQIDAFVGKTAELGKAFNELNPDVDAVIGALGETNTVFGKHLEMLKKIKGEAAAMAAATEKLAQLIGQQGVNSLKQFGNDAQDFGNEMGKAFTLMKASVAELINSSGILLAMSQGISRANRYSMFNRRVTDITGKLESGTKFKDLTKDEQKLFELSMRESAIQEGTGYVDSPIGKEWQRMTRNMTKMGVPWMERWARTDTQQTDLNNTRNDIDRTMSGLLAKEGFGELLGKGADKNQALDDQILKLERIFQMGEKEAAIQEKINNKVKDGITLTDEAYEKKLRQINALNEINNVWKGIATSIEDGVVSAINGAIDGTKTLGEVASSVFRQISQQLIKYGVNAGLSAIPGIGHIFQTRATGGPVTGGSPYIVGEKGPELFVPGSSGNIVPNNEMGGANIVVNVDASGSAVEGDEGQGAELGRMLGAAIQAELIKEKRPGGLLAGR